MQTHFLSLADKKDAFSPNLTKLYCRFPVRAEGNLVLNVISTQSLVLYYNSWLSGEVSHRVFWSLVKF